MRIVKRLVLGLFIIALALCVGVAVLKAVWDARYYHGYDSAASAQVGLTGHGGLM